MLKNNKGITLIALVITIIVLLILAGVSIAMLTGENGILKQATTAVSDTEVGAAEEAIKLAIANIIAESEGTPTGGYTSALFTASINKINTDYTFTPSQTGDGSTDSPYSNITVTVTTKDTNAKEIGTWTIDQKTGAVSKNS